MSNESDNIKIFSFSCRNEKNIAAVKKLKNYSKKHGVNFSFLVLKAIEKYNLELNNG